MTCSIPCHTTFILRLILESNRFIQHPVQQPYHNILNQYIPLTIRFFLLLVDQCALQYTNNNALYALTAETKR